MNAVAKIEAAALSIMKIKAEIYLEYTVFCRVIGNTDSYVEKEFLLSSQIWSCTSAAAKNMVKMDRNEKLLNIVMNSALTSNIMIMSFSFLRYME